MHDGEPPPLSPPGSCVHGQHCWLLGPSSHLWRVHRPKRCMWAGACCRRQHRRQRSGLARRHHCRLPAPLLLQHWRQQQRRQQEQQGQAPRSRRQLLGRCRRAARQLRWLPAWQRCPAGGRGWQAAARQRRRWHTPQHQAQVQGGARRGRAPASCALRGLWCSEGGAAAAAQAAATAQARGRLQAKLRPGAAQGPGPGRHSSSGGSGSRTASGGRGSSRCSSSRQRRR